MNEANLQQNVLMHLIGERPPQLSSGIAEPVPPTKTTREGVWRSIGIVLGKALDTCWRSVTKGINTLIVVTRDESDHASRDNLVHKLLVDGIQILIFINY